MADSDFWRDLAVQFRAVPVRYGLSADRDYVIGSGGAGQWNLRGGVGVNVHNQFTALAMRGAARLANVGTSDSLTVWFEALWKEGSSVRLTERLVEVDEDENLGADHLRGTIDNICEASANYCKVLEIRALEAENEERQRNDPRNWSALRQRQAAVDKIKELRAATPKEIQESFVRNVLAEQYGIKPEEVSPKQIQFEVTGLLRDHPAITMPLEQIPESTSPPEPISEPQPKSPEEQPKGVTPEPSAAEEKPRRRLSATVHCPAAARKMETYLEVNGIGQTEFAIKAGTTDRTLRSFRKTGKIKRDIFEEIAKAMGMTKESLLKD